MRFFGRLLFAVLGGILVALLVSASPAFAQAPGGAAPDGPAPPSPAPEPPSAPREETVEKGPAPAAGGEGATPSSPGASADELGAGDDDESNKKIPANMGRVQGTVVDGQTGEAMIEAQVTVVQTGKKVLTDIDGNYKVTLRPGTYDFRFFAELRPARRISHVKVTVGKTTRIDVALGAGDDKKIAVQEVEVVATPDIATEAVQVVRRQKAAVVSDGISAQQIARSPDSNASDSIKRVVAATVQDNRYVIIRGLGGRYSSTLLNGVSLPSPDPDTPAAPLDLFPAALLANLTVAKGFSPDMPGNFAGGALIIETRDFPSKFMLKLRAQVSGDTESTFHKAYSYKGGGLDFLGYDDGGRALPSAIPGDKMFGDASLTREQADAQAASFSNNWMLRNHGNAPNLGFTATVGDTMQFKGQKLGYLASANYSNRWVRRLTKIQRVGAKGPDGELLPSDEQLTEDMGMQIPALGGLVTVGYAPSPAHRVNLTTLYTHNTENSASRTVGMNNARIEVDRLRFRFLERAMLFSQLVGEDALAPGKVLLGWQASIARTTQDEPDTRDLMRTLVPAGTYNIASESGAAERLYSTLGDTTAGGGFDLSFLLDGVKLKAGGNVLNMSRVYQTRRFHFNTPPSLAALPADAAFASDRLTASRVQERTQNDDGYDARRTTFAAYVMADVVKLDPVRVILGQRFEASELDLQMVNKSDPTAPVLPRTNRTDKSLLPSVNAVLGLGKDQNLRAGYSRTVARPHFREVSPALYYDYVRSRAIGGNPNLKETSIQNADLRWEMFLGPTELLAASVFYKKFHDPIERTNEAGGSGDNILFRNADSARVYGIELETRLAMNRLSRSLEGLSLGANLSVIQSRVDVVSQDGKSTPTERPLQGQSPYVANISLGYRIEKTKTTIDALYNVFGERLLEVGTGGNKDVYEQPLHRVDLTVSQPLPAGLVLKVSATNLLDQRVVFKQSDVEILAYKPGTAFFGSIEWTLNEGKDN